MLATMVDSSKFSEPMMMAGLALEARTEAKAAALGQGDGESQGADQRREGGNA